VSNLASAPVDLLDRLSVDTAESGVEEFLLDLMVMGQGKSLMALLDRALGNVQEQLNKTGTDPSSSPGHPPYHGVRGKRALYLRLLCRRLQLERGQGALEAGLRIL
jgi:hypothetical protein